MKSSARPSSSRSSVEQVEHGRLHRDVERGGDLVADEEVGTRRERARDRDALPLAARQLGREPRRPCAPAGGRARAAPSTSAARLGARQAAQHAGRPRDLVGDAPPRVERVGRVLEDDLDPPARLARAAPRLAAPAARRRGGCVPPTARAGRRRSARSSSCRSRTRRRARGTRPAATVNDTSAAATTVSWRLPCTAREPLDLEQRRRRARTRVAHGEHRLEPDRRRLAPLEAAHVVAAARPPRAAAAPRAQRSTRCAQRGANAQPGGRSPTPTATPGMPRSRRGAT